MEKDSELKGAHSIRMLRIQSVMCVPLRVLRKVSKSSREKRLKTIGIIYVDSHSASRVFNDDDMGLLLALANQAATEIDKARVYRELERAHKNLLELDRMKNEFIAIASHELHTPLTSIVGFLDLFEMQEKQHKLPDVFKEGMDIIREGVNNLAKKINEITQIAAIDEYRLELKLKKVPLKAFLRESSRRFIPFIKKRNQTLSLQFQKDLPTVILDPEKIQIVLSNLMTNAIRFTPDGGKLKLRASVNPAEPAQVLISVTDTGIGIPEEDYDRIFEKFVVLGDVMQHSSGTIEFRTSGVGLGLAIAKGIVESHGGSISVKSDVDNGSTFTFSLPIEGRMDMAKSFEI
jgi:signal transduction histidine kinase